MPMDTKGMTVRPAHTSGKAASKAGTDRVI